MDVPVSNYTYKWRRWVLINLRRHSWGVEGNVLKVIKKVTSSGGGNVA